MCLIRLQGHRSHQPSPPQMRWDKATQTEGRRGLLPPWLLSLGELQAPTGLGTGWLGAGGEGREGTAWPGPAGSQQRPQHPSPPPRGGWPRVLRLPTGELGSVQPFRQRANIDCPGSGMSVRTTDQAGGLCPRPRPQPCRDAAPPTAPPRPQHCRDSAQRPAHTRQVGRATTSLPWAPSSTSHGPACPAGATEPRPLWASGQCSGHSVGIGDTASGKGFRQLDDRVSGRFPPVALRLTYHLGEQKRGVERESQRRGGEQRRGC